MSPAPLRAGPSCTLATAGNLRSRGQGSLAAYSVPFEGATYAQVHRGGTSYDMPLAATVKAGREAYPRPTPLGPDTAGTYETIGQDNGKEVAGRPEYGFLIRTDDGSQADPNAATHAGGGAPAVYATLA